jgi:uncharacterized protein YndB with AHSA1/START domain
LKIFEIAMPTIEQTVDIAAPAETVWSIVADPTLLPKLVPDIISSESEPSGMATVGQKGHAFGKIGGRRTEIFSEVTEVVPNKKLVFSQRPGGLFKTLSVTVRLEPSKKGTRATQEFHYEASMGYLGKALSAILVNRTVNKNAKAFLVNVKELAELRELPKTT